MSPEQARGEELGAQTDIFSLGIILYEMLANRRLFLGSTDFETLENIKNCSIPSIREINPNVSERLESVLLQALAKDPADRFLSAGAFQNSLSKILYSEYPHFTQDDLITKLNSLFGTEIKQEEKNLRLQLDQVNESQVEMAQQAYQAESSQSSFGQNHIQVTPSAKSGALKDFIWKNRFILSLAIIICSVIFYALSKNNKPETPKVATVNKSQKNFRFETDPPDSKIFVNGEMRGQTPTDIILPLNKRFLIKIEKKGFKTIQEDILTNADDTSLVFRLVKEKPEFGALSINTNPAGAEVFFNGKPLEQKTPAYISDLPFQKEVIVRIERDGYEPVQKKVLISESSQDIYFDLKPGKSLLIINPTPASAKIYLNNQPKESVIENVKRNETYQLRVEAKGYLPEERSIKVTTDRLEIDIPLKKKQAKVGRISISAIPWAKIIIGGKVIGSESHVLNYPLPVGKHTVILQHPDYPEVKRTVRIRHNENKKLIVDLREESQK